MPLINLQTDLKSLKYGNDRIGGGNSGQPYITTNIPDDISSYIGTTDFLLRGGIRATQDSLVDVARLGKMFVDTKSPNGILFTAKQQLLSRTAPRTQTSGLLNEGVYTPLSTLAQAGVVAFGGHLNKQGINPFAGTGAYATNESLYGVRVKSNQPSEENRLVQLVELTSNGRPGTKKNGVTLNDGINVMVYTGGPSSTLGVGSTGIRYSLSSQTPLTRFPDSSNFTSNATSLGQNDWTFSAKLIEEQSPQSLEGRTATPVIQDFRRILRNNLQGTDKETATNSGATPLAPSYLNKNIEQRVNLGDPGNRGFVGGKQKIYADYSKGINYGSLSIPNLGPFSPGLDKITSVPIYRSEEVSSDENLNDLVSFRIAVIDNDNPAFKTFLHFRAFLGPMSDTYTAEWNPFKYLGRGENFYTYGGFTRQISLSWTVAAQSKQELIPMYKKLNYLASSLTPDYSEQRFMRGNLAELTVGGYIVDQPGIITSLTYDIQEDSPWEIGINTDGNNDVNSPQMPHILRVSGFNFIPIQRFIPRKQDLAFNNKSLNDPLDENSTGFATSYGVERYISMNGDDSYGSTPFAANATQGAIPGTLSGPSPTAGLQPINLPNLNSSYKWG